MASAAADCYAKESGVGVNQGDVHAARRAELDERVRALSPAGTPEYWRQVERPPEGQALPLEVLARCCRERFAAGAVADSERIFECVLRRVQQAMDGWAWRIAHRAHGGAHSQLKDDLEQECLLRLWQELTEEGPTLLWENFAHALHRLQQRVAHDVMEKAGEWKRRNIAQPTRIPRRAIDSLEAGPPGDAQDPIADAIADPTAEQAFARADLSDLLDMVRHLDPDRRGLIFDHFWRGDSQREMAEARHITTRTVYNRLQAALAQLGARYAAGEEVHHE
jgi:RNA polymerase sigma factor (sigma-70 family)